MRTVATVATKLNGYDFFNNFIILSVLSFHKVILIVMENLQNSSIMIRLINMMNQKQECSITPREHK